MKKWQRYLLWGIMLCVFAVLVVKGIQAGDLTMIQMESSTL